MALEKVLMTRSGQQLAQQGATRSYHRPDFASCVGDTALGPKCGDYSLVSQNRSLKFTIEGARYRFGTGLNAIFTGGLTVIQAP